MALHADAIIERRRLRRKLTFWRVLVLVLLIAAIAVMTFYMTDSERSRNTPHIAKIAVSGTIFTDEDLLKRIKDVTKNDAVKGVIIDINSPGGTTVGGEVIYEAVRKLADKKPVVAQVGTLAASAGYIIAMATDHIVAHQTSLIGSIGVLFQYPDISALLDKIGVKVETIKSSPLKAEPNFFSPASDEAKAMIDHTVKDTYAWFVDIVKERRPIPEDQLAGLINGSIYTGRQAVKNKLIDAIGDQETSVEWLQSKGIDKKLTVIEWEEETATVNRLFSQAAINLLSRTFASALGLSDQGSTLLHDKIGDRIFLDGMLSVWHGTDTDNPPR